MYIAGYFQHFSFNGSFILISVVNCSRRLFTIMAMCLSGLFVHGFLPDAMLSVVLVPIIKDKCGKINSKDNYRPVALASVTAIAWFSCFEWCSTGGNPISIFI